MNTHPFHFLVLLCLLAMIWLLRLAMLRFHTRAAPKPKTTRPLKPKTADDCPFCRAEKDKGDDLQAKQALKPWRDVKSPRGRKKTLSTQGYACPNQACRYYGIVDERIHLQLDELWAQVRQGGQVVWVWAMVEASSKLVPVLKLGPRTMHLAYSVVHDLFQILQPGCIPIFTSDGLKLYFYALTAHFGRWQLPEGARKPVWEIPSAFLYAQLKKIHRRRRLMRVERRMLCGECGHLKDGLQALGLSSSLSERLLRRSTPPSSSASTSP